jgi:sugar lactone lactonase YvrE
MTQINAKVECVLDCHDKLGEGIFWCPVERALYWVDVPMPSYLHRWDPKSGDHETWPMPEMITSLAKRNDGTLLVASHHGLNVFDPRKATLVRVAAPEADRPGNRANDGCTDRRGRFWFGTMCNNVAPDGTYLDVLESTGVLYKVEPGMRIVSMEGEVGISNAICWSPDDRTMYFADTLLGAIHAYDFDLELGAISNKRVFAKLDGHGYPDGATVDADGYLWNARWEGSSVVRFAPDGRVDAIVAVPVSRVTCCAFGGDDLDTLYVTTSRLHLNEAELAAQPHAGGVFALKPGVKGLSKPPFEG